MMGILEYLTRTYMPPICPSKPYFYLCPDCNKRVVWKEDRYIHQTEMECSYYSNPTEYQKSMEAQLRIQYWIKKGVSLSIYAPCSGKMISGKYTHSLFTTSIQIDKGDTIVCHKHALFVYDSDIQLKSICATNHHSFRKDARIHSLGPNEILAKDYKQIQKDIDNLYQVEISLHCVQNTNTLYCIDCVKERSMLSAKNKIGNTFELPWHKPKSLNPSIKTDKAAS